MRRARRAVRGSLVAIALLGPGPGAAWGQAYIYPAKGQSAEQQQKDKGECHGWAI
jgi:hypothetical protein